MSLDMAALALQCRRKTLADAVKAGKLKAYVDPTHSRRSRILTENLQTYVRKHWKEEPHD
jgi:hypothetical protein